MMAGTAATGLKKIHLGCGHEIIPGFTNLDSAPLPGVDIVHDLTKFPWPFRDGEGSEILIKHVLEHLPNTIQVLEEIWRIAAHGGKVTIRVPFWNSSDFITDPTHVKAFNEHTFDFFDPRQEACKHRFYYSKARFLIRKKKYWIRVLGKYVPIVGWPLCRLIEIPARYFCNVIQVMEVELEAVKP